MSDVAHDKLKNSNFVFLPLLVELLLIVIIFNPERGTGNAEEKGKAKARKRKVEE